MPTIKILPHEPEHKKELFGLIGEACASMAVHKALGNPITSTRGDTWIVSTNEAGEMTGMCGMSALKSKSSIKLHGLYAGDDEKLASKLRKEAAKQAKANGASEITITDRLALVATYEKEGWSVIGQRGQNYVAFRKDI